MKLRTSILPLAGLAFGAVALANTPAAQVERSPEAAAKLAKRLQGRTEGAPVSCIPNFRGNSRMEVIDAQTLLFRDGSTVYIQQPVGRCDRLDDDGYALVNRKAGGTQICSGDINELIDLSTGVYGGSCIYGPFVPYRK